MKHKQLTILFIFITIITTSLHALSIHRVASKKDEHSLTARVRITLDAGELILSESLRFSTDKGTLKRFKMLASSTSLYLAAFKKNKQVYSQSSDVLVKMALPKEQVLEELNVYVSGILVLPDESIKAFIKKCVVHEKPIKPLVLAVRKIEKKVPVVIPEPTKEEVPTSSVPTHSYIGFGLLLIFLCVIACMYLSTQMLKIAIEVAMLLLCISMAFVLKKWVSSILFSALLILVLFCGAIYFLKKRDTDSSHDAAVRLVVGGLCSFSIIPVFVYYFVLTNTWCIRLVLEAFS